MDQSENTPRKAQPLDAGAVFDLMQTSSRIATLFERALHAAVPRITVPQVALLRMLAGGGTDEPTGRKRMARPAVKRLVAMGLAAEGATEGAAPTLTAAGRAALADIDRIVADVTRQLSSGDKPMTAANLRSMNRLHRELRKFAGAGKGNAADQEDASDADDDA